MTKFIMRELKCTCGNEFEAKVYISFDLNESPHLNEQVQMGTINSHRCPGCERVIVGIPPVILALEEKGKKAAEAVAKYEW